jgi:hypothetical protein
MSSISRPISKEDWLRRKQLEQLEPGGSFGVMIGAKPPKERDGFRNENRHQSGTGNAR